MGLKNVPKMTNFDMFIVNEREIGSRYEIQAELIRYVHTLLIAVYLTGFLIVESALTPTGRCAVQAP